MKYHLTLGLLLVSLTAAADWTGGTEPYPDIDQQYAISNQGNDVVLTYFCTAGISSFGIGFYTAEIKNGILEINGREILFPPQEGYGPQTGYSRTAEDITYLFSVLAAPEPLEIVNDDTLYYLETTGAEIAIVEAYRRCIEDLDKALT